MADQHLPPTADEINALPEHIRDYIHNIEANADPAGTVRELMVAKDTCRSLEKRVLELENYKSESEFLEWLRLFVGTFATQKDAAKWLEISPAYLSDILSGRRLISDRVAMRLGYDRRVIYVHDLLGFQFNRANRRRIDK